jgi:hypothetical protein
MADSATGAAGAPANTPPTVIAIKVQFELDTLDGLRKVMFGLEKDLKGTDVIWTIHFQLQERTKTSDDFTNVVTLDVTVDEPQKPSAEVAAQVGLTPAQSAHALGPAADDAKGTTTGDVDPGDAANTINDTLAQ